MNTKLTLIIDKEVIKTAKKWCIDNEVTFGSLVEKLLIEALKIEKHA